MFFRSLVAAALIAAASSADAADAEGRAAPKGFGLASCEQFLEEAKKSDNQQTVRAIVAWVNGYLTAANIYQEDTYDIAPWQNPVYLLNVYARLCQQQPNQNFVSVVHYVNNALKPNRLTEQNEMVAAQAGDRRVAVYKDILTDVQEELIEKGFLKGTADGVFGPMTQTALENYQRAQDLPVSGLPDSFTVERLLFAQRPAAPAATTGEPLQPEQQ